MVIPVPVVAYKKDELMSVFLSTLESIVSTHLSSTTIMRFSYAAFTLAVCLSASLVGAAPVPAAGECYLSSRTTPLIINYPL